MPRKKEFTLDGLVLFYSPLTLAQTEELLTRKRPEESASAEEKNSFYRRWNLDVTRMGLANAGEKTSAGEPWTNENILTELDPVVYNAVEEAILKFTGLLKKDQTLGEAQAAISQQN